MKKVLFDTNIILDVLLARSPHDADSARALDAAAAGLVQGFVPGHAVTTIAYIMEREVGRTRSRKLAHHLLSKLTVSPVTDSVIRDALASPIQDFEDAVCEASARSESVRTIVTRNVDDFRPSTLTIVHPALFRP